MSRAGELDETVSAGADSTPPGHGTSELPATIGRFTITSKLGAGGHGMVLLATDPMLGRSIALKVLREATEPDEESRRRFLREAQTMAKLVHENIIVVHDVGTHQGRDYVAMEYIAGSTLATWQATKPWRDVVDVYLRAGRGLAHAHDAGFVHRDFKPANVLVGDDGRVRVTDFGLAAMVGAASTSIATTSDPGSELQSSLTATGALMGTPRYMAPEQHLAEAVDARADQFAFCAALYEALYGKPAFDGATYAELANAVINRPPATPPASDVPALLERAVLRGLSRKPADRFASMHELLAVVREAIERRTRVPRLALIGASALVLAIAIGGAVVFFSDDEPAKPARAAPIPTRPLTKMEQHAQIEYEAADVLYQKSQFAEAAAGFLAAYEYQHLPLLLYDAAAATQLLGKRNSDVATLREAIALFRRYLAEGTTTQGERDAVKNHIDGIEELIATLEAK